MELFEWQTDSNHKLVKYNWLDVNNAKAVVIIVHGMAEHMGRYDQFAVKLNEAGYLVTGVDLLANGKTARDRLGQATERCYQDNVSIICELISKVKKETNLPILLLAHSYGSFVAQRCLQLESEDIDGVILSGSACLNTVLIKSARVLAAIQRKLFGADKPARLITKLNFGSYDKLFKSPIKHNAWLSRDMDEVNKYNKDPLCDQIFTIGFYYSLFKGVKDIYSTKEVSKINKSLNILIAAGDNDPVGGNAKLVHRLYDIYNENAINNVRLRIYQGARHEIINEINKEEVITEIIEYYNSIVTPLSDSASDK